MGIPETITNDLNAIKGIVLIERLQLTKVMDEQALQLTGAIDEGTAVKVGKLTGADVLVVGAFQKQAQMIRLTARFVNVQTSEIFQTAKVTGKMDDIFYLQDQIVQYLCKNLNIELKQNELEQLAEKPTESMEAYQHFGQGSLLQARKDYTGAAKELQQASAADPKFSLAKKRFAEIFLSLNNGNYWTYGTTSKIIGMGDDNETPGTETSRAGGHELFNGMSVFSYITRGEAQSDVLGNIKSETSSYYIKKDDGVYLVGAKGGSSMGTATMTYDPPYLYYPYDMEVGKQWEVNSAILMEGKVFHMSMKGALKQEEKRKVIKRDTITVPAGTFDCFVIESRSSSKGKVHSCCCLGIGLNYSTTVVTTTWFAQGVGTIKTRMETKEKKFTIVNETVLREYHIEE
jgi:TolB-like protein